MKERTPEQQAAEYRKKRKALERVVGWFHDNLGEHQILREIEPEIKTLTPDKLNPKGATKAARLVSFLSDSGGRATGTAICNEFGFSKDTEKLHATMERYQRTAILEKFETDQQNTPWIAREGKYFVLVSVGPRPPAGWTGYLPKALRLEYKANGKKRQRVKI